jgi:hypothetical protein
MICAQDLNTLDENLHKKVIYEFNDKLKKKLSIKIILRLLSGSKILESELTKSVYLTFKNECIYYNSKENQDYFYEIKYDLRFDMKICKYKCGEQCKEIIHNLNEICELCILSNPSKIITSFYHSSVYFVIDNTSFDTFEGLLEEYNWEPGNTYEITLISVSDLVLTENIKAYIYNNLKIDGESIRNCIKNQQYYLSLNHIITFNDIVISSIYFDELINAYNTGTLYSYIYNKLYQYYDSDIKQILKINIEKNINRERKLYKNFDYDNWQLSYFQKKCIELNSEYRNLVFIYKKSKILYYLEQFIPKHWKSSINYKYIIP